MSAGATGPNRLPFILGIGAMAVLVCYAVAVQIPAVGLYHDDGVYLVTAKALAEGRGYRIISLPNEIPQTKYPILFPLALSLVWRITPPFPENTLYLKLVPLSAALAWFFLVYFLLRRETKSLSLAAAVVLLTAASPHILFFSTALLAESLFSALLWGGLILLRRCEDEGATGHNLLGAAALSVAAFHTRTIGFTLVATGLVVLARSAGFRRAVMFGLLCLLLMAPWILWVLYAGNVVSDEQAFYTSANYESWNVLFGFEWEQKLRIVGLNIFYFLCTPFWLMGMPFAWLWPLFLALGILAVYGFLVNARRDFNVIHVFTILYVGVVLLWAWMPMRFVVPIYPLVLLFAWDGGRRIARRLVSLRGRHFAARTAMVAVGLLAGWTLGSAVQVSARLGVVCPRADCTSPWRDTRSLLAYLRTNTPPNTLLMGSVDPLLYLYTGRKAVRAFEVDPIRYYYTPGSDFTDSEFGQLGPPESLARRMTETAPDYLVAMPTTSMWDSLLRRQIAGILQRNPTALRRLMGTAAGSRVYEVVPSELPKTSQLPVMRGEVLTPLKDSTTR